MSEEKKCKKSMKKAIEKKEHKCTCDTNGCCSNSTDIPSAVLGATIRDVPDSAFSEYSKADMNDILSIIKDYCSVSGKSFEDIAIAIAEEERCKNEKLFVDMVEKVDEAITSFMQNSTDSDETKNMLIKEMFSKLTSLYLSSALKNKIDEWKKVQKYNCADTKDKINKCTEEDKKDEPKVLFKSIEDIFPWLKDEASADTEDDEDDSDSEYLKDFDFPFTYKDEKRNIKISADIIGESNDSIDIRIETEYEDKNMCVSNITETSYDRDEKLSKFFEDCIENINDLCKTKKSCFNFN
jgi:hypothetical protein